MPSVPIYFFESIGCVCEETVRFDRFYLAPPVDYAEGKRRLALLCWKTAMLFGEGAEAGASCYVPVDSSSEVEGNKRYDNTGNSKDCHSELPCPRR